VELVNPQRVHVTLVTPHQRVHVKLVNPQRVHVTLVTPHRVSLKLVTPRRVSCFEGRVRGRKLVLERPTVGSARGPTKGGDQRDNGRRSIRRLLSHGLRGSSPMVSEAPLPWLGRSDDGYPRGPGPPKSLDFRWTPKMYHRKPIGSDPEVQRFRCTFSVSSDFGGPGPHRWRTEGPLTLRKGESRACTE
jgi:hypothetical protein